MSNEKNDPTGKNPERRGVSRTDDDGWAEAAGTLPKPTADDEWSDETGPASVAEEAADGAGKPASVEAAGELASARAEQGEAGADEPAEAEEQGEAGADEPAEAEEQGESEPADGGEAAEPASLREAAGVTGDSGGPGGEEPSGEPGPPRPRKSRRVLFILVLLAVLAALIAAAWLAGTRNSQSYYLVCGANQIRAERGDFFPPWGTEDMIGPRWQPIEFILPLAECDDQAFDSREALQAAYRAELLGQVEGWLKALQPGDEREELDTVVAQLEQALSLSRSSDNASASARKHILRLMGDVEYWRARDQLDKARSELEDALAKLGEAVDKNPVHVESATEWQAFLTHLIEEIEAGPPSLRPEPTAPAPPPATGPAPVEEAPAVLTPEQPGAPDEAQPAEPSEPGAGAEPEAETPAPDQPEAEAPAPDQPETPAPDQPEAEAPAEPKVKVQPAPAPDASAPPRRKRTTQGSGTLL